NQFSSSFFINCSIEFLAVCGLIGNILNIIILSHHRFKDTTNILLTSLSCDDLLCSLTEAIFRVPYIMQAFYPCPPFLNFCRQYLLILINLALSQSQLLAAVIAVERLAAVWFPFLVSRVFTPRRVMILIVLLHVITFLMVSPGFVRYHGIWRNAQINNVTIYYFFLKDMSNADLQVINWYMVFFVNIIYSTLPLLIILVSSTLIMIKMHIISKEMKNRLASGVKSKKLKILKATKMLLVVCFFSLLVCFVTCILYIVPMLIEVDHHFFKVCDEITHFFSQLETVVNFIIYVSMSSKFAQTYKKLFCTF
ncbi:unnamed protein product, partial [Lymnaea stagnalis]